MVEINTLIGDCAPNYIIIVIGLTFIVAIIGIVDKYATCSVDIRNTLVDIDKNTSVLSQYIYGFLMYALILLACAFINILFHFKSPWKDTLHILIKYFLIVCSLVFSIVPLEFYRAYKEYIAISDVIPMNDDDIDCKR